MADRGGRRRRVKRSASGPGGALNLASEPLGGYRAFAACACLMAGLLLGVAGALGWSWSKAGGTPQEHLDRQRALDQQRQELTVLAEEARSTIAGDRANRVLEQTELLNGLLVRKGVSWTQTFVDLESVLPPAVRMLTIQPEVAGQDTLRLDMTVSAREPADFIEFLRELERSEVFQFPAVRGSAPPTEGDPTHRYRLTVNYDQQL